ncbi:MAG: aminomethyl-transferring glycine dehydrogenase subunit GcvPA [Rhodospirillales bacterium]|jgi:glycine dehydrogenase subunit 1|nr:aminomethyl-transferring glycine dehydrogenase subunit GcvPA [Rhodospirillales bacterium]HIJ43898.1 aminomethyl-transferring glycine dehydrogenase subunit GcvPA [Rhodospirillaceae bacterium]MDP7097331.1 aminomethyl-transferring glycine dehydrogenase subunit GcvPA [Rhodospirillales bacterium]MDP7215756.1 aminomethyl-transferring glycine dehydrogenase subunit GcvPA [Rhodospirillales bacterium]HIJ94007.1 aminomethyl-transferring glycine dehydrogenase subunit GcvPA [Rhodospirillaceae bacterium]
MRYLPLTDDDRRRMLAAIGVESVDDFFRDVPESARLKEPVDLPRHSSEMEVERVFTRMAAKNLSPDTVPSFLGAGAYRHHVPAAVDHLIQRGEFLTAYTPYQPEISQGTLQCMFEFQTQVALITGMDVANASMYDGATACSEAVMMATRINNRAKVVLSGGLHPHYRDVTATMGRFLGLDIVAAAPDWQGKENPARLVDGETACLVVQNPGFFGHLRDLRPLADACHGKGALLVAVVTEPLSLGIVESPGAMGADIVAGEGQSLGNALNFGGPTVGLLAVRQKYLRQIPGRLVGQTVDTDGRRGYVLTLSTREQHIRREKATSNICTNSGLCALAFSIHLTLLGEQGFVSLARLNHARAVTLADKLAALKGVEVINETFFNEFTLSLPKPAAAVAEALAGMGVFGGVPASRLDPERSELEPLLLVAATETASPADIDGYVGALRQVL